MPVYLEIAVNVPQVSGVFHYHLPPELEDLVQVGHLVEVPFGQQLAQGVVLGRVEQPAIPETRPVSNLIDPDTVLTLAQIELARKLAHDTLAPLAACVHLMIPSGLGKQTDTLYWLNEHAPQGKGGTSGKLSVLQQRLIEILRKRGALRGRQIDQSFRHQDWSAAARSLQRGGIIATRPVLPPPTIQPKYVRTVQLACSPEMAQENMESLGRAGSPALQRRQAILRFLLREPGPVEAAWVYAESGGSLPDLRFLAEQGLVVLSESETWRDPLAELDFVPSEPLALTQAQQAAWNKIQAALQNAAQGQAADPFLLHGVTGSGKTEIYLYAVAETLRLGRQAIVLVPEIAMTPQTVRRFVARFPGRVGLAHSRLSQGERYDTWRRARQGLLDIIIGPRSALFTPFANLGLVVVDESHDDSYYQDDILPFYHARQVAVEYTRLVKAVCLMGSATPDIDSFYQAQQGHWNYLSLPARILAHKQSIQAQMNRLAQSKLEVSPGGLVSHYQVLEEEAETTELPAVQMVDMRQELKAGNTSIFSRALQTSLGRVLQQGQQAILFLNRRGAATYVFCRECGLVLKCPRCDIPLTYHTEAIGMAAPGQILLCHRCNYQRKFPLHCPQCSSTRIRHFGAGTESVENEVQKLFPKANTLRWDYETTRQKGAHELILSHFSNHHADILIGTQMVAKGLDLPWVTLVGIVLADVGLNLPDYRAAERTFQLVTQVSGRAGRSPLGGEVILQTFQPEQYALQDASHHDYLAFYQHEMAQRKAIGYPPYTRLVRLEYRHSDARRAEETCQKMAAQIRQWLQDEAYDATEMIGPAPSFFARFGGMYRWQIILRGPDPVNLLSGRNLDNWRVEVDPVSLL